MAGGFEVLGALLQLHSSAAHRNTNSSYQAILVVLSRVGCNWVCHLFVTRITLRGGLTAVVMAMVAAQKYESPLLYLRLDTSLAGKHQALKGNSSLLCRFQVRKESTYEKNTL